MNLLTLPAFSDQDIWIHEGREGLAVDPGDAAPVARALDALGPELAAILVTHHHPDPIGGVDALRGMQLEVINVPGWTAGHAPSPIAYLQTDNDR